MGDSTSCSDVNSMVCADWVFAVTFGTGQPDVLTAEGAVPTERGGICHSVC